MFAGVYFWWPKLTGRMLDEKLGKIHFWMLFIGFHTTFLIQHWLGVEGMARRYADYLPEEGFQAGEHRVEHRCLAARGLDDPVPLQRVADVEEGSARRDGRPVGVRRLARVGDVLPAAAAQLHVASRIRSERPAFDLHHPEAPRGHAGAGSGNAGPGDGTG